MLGPRIKSVDAPVSNDCNKNGRFIDHTLILRERFDVI
jgi:hypothetical protein